MSLPLRVLIVEDSLTLRHHLRVVLEAAPGWEVVGAATDGREAIEMCTRLRPNVVTMDMMLPRMSGLAATEYIMAHCPTPILIVSSSFNRGEVFKTYDALAAGAVDVIEKPAGGSEGEWERAFLARLSDVARVRVITHPRAKLAALASQAGAPLATRPGSQPTQLIAIGASTGGPAALVSVLSAIPRDNRIPICVVLHLSAVFAVEFAAWMDGLVPLGVEYARHGERLSEIGGGVRLAPPNHHLLVRGRALEISAAPERHSCRPSVDVLFESVAQSHGPRAIGCLLTGMGKDGGAGLLQMRQAGARTIAQDEESCVVFGMPREAILLGGAEEVLSLSQIGSTLTAEASRRGVCEG
jgi:two-component system chemotaxis response regulator CheB